jgi:hypothetical protein
MRSGPPASTQPDLDHAHTYHRNTYRRRPLVLSACGGSDDDGGGLTADQTAAAANFIALTDARGGTADEACVTDLAAELSDDDAAILAAATEGTRPAVSAEGQALIDRVDADCVS